MPTGDEEENSNDVTARNESTDQAPTEDEAIYKRLKPGLARARGLGRLIYAVLKAEELVDRLGLLPNEEID